LSIYASLSAFVHWIILGLLIPFVNWNIKPWIKGLIIGELTALPFIIMVFESDPKSAVPMLIFSAILGMLVGAAGNKFIKQGHSSDV